MKITRLATYRPSPRWMFLKVETDEGVIGWDEPVIEGRACAVEAAARELFYYFIGQNPSRINDLWQTMYCAGFYRGGLVLMSVVTGIGQALWDTKGKVLGVPVYRLLGGLVRDKMRTYSWVGDDRPADVIAGTKALQAVDFGHSKFNGCEEMGITDTSCAVDVVVVKVAEIHSTFSNTVEFGLDFCDRVSTSMARVLIKELGPYHPLSIEEPVPAEQTETYTRLAVHTHLPIAVGERMFSRFDFKCVLEAGGVSTPQPDLSHTGGTTEYVKIIAMAEAHDVALAPHCPLGPITLAVCLHVDFVSRNATLQEQSMGTYHNRGAELLDYVRNKADLTLEGGYIQPSRLPGLGVDIDGALVIERSKEAPDWCNPVWRHVGGSMTEW